MCKFLLASAVGLLMCVNGFAADDCDAIIAKAVKAYGGVANLTKHAASKSKNKGTLYIGVDLPFTQDISIQHPNKFREEMELEANGQKVAVITAFDGEKGWLSVNGKVQELNDKILAELKEAAHLLRLGRLVFLKDKSCTLTPLGEAKVNDKPAVGIRVSTKGYRDVSLYFDKETGLFAKMERRVVDPMSGQELTEERVILEHKTNDGIPTPKRVAVFRDGKKFMDAEVLEIKHLDKLDDSIFTKP